MRKTDTKTGACSCSASDPLAQAALGERLSAAAQRRLLPQDPPRRQGRRRYKTTPARSPGHRVLPQAPATADESSALQDNACS